MRYLRSFAYVAVGAFLVAAFALSALYVRTAPLVGKYDNATVYLYAKPCKDNEGLQTGEVKYHTGKIVGFCWVKQDGAVWIIADDGALTVEPAEKFK